MSSRPMPCWSTIPSLTSRASTIMPAQVASVGRPLAMAARSGSSRPTRSSSIVIVVLSPPGSTMPSRPSRSSLVLTRRVLAPTAPSAWTCSANAPCIARTPITGALVACARRLPASGSEQLFLRDGWDLEPGHRLSQSRGDLREDVGLVEIRRGRDDRLGALQGVLGLEDARAHEQAVDAELHHQRRIRGRCDATSRKIDDGQAPESLALGQHLDGGSDLLGFVDELRLVHALQLADVGRHALERHHGARAGILGDARVLGGDHVHDHATLEHLGEARLDLEGTLHGPVSIARSVAFGHESHSTPGCNGQPQYGNSACLAPAKPFQRTRSARLAQNVWIPREELEPFEYQRPLAGVLVVRQQPIPVQACEHVHLLEHVEQRPHGSPGQVRVGSRASVFASRVELADEEQRLDSREGDPELANRAVRLLTMEMEDHAVAVSLERAVEVAAQHLAVEEADRNLSGRSLRSQVRIAGQLDPFHGCKRDPGRLVVLEPAGIVDLDQEVRFVEIEIASDPFEGFIIEKADDYLGHAITYSTNPHFAGVLRTARRPRRREHFTHVATCLRTASAWLRRSLPAR